MILHHVLFATALAVTPAQALPFGTGGAADCVATGVCPAPAAPGGAPSGTLFIATGLVAFGAAGLRRERRQRRGTDSGAHHAKV